MNEGHLRRLESALASPGLVERLAGLTASDLSSLLLEVFARRAPQRGPGELLDALEGRFVRPSPLSPATLADFDTRANALLAPAFECLELSPLAPLGACSSLASVHQDKVVSAARGGEVVSDPTNVLALLGAVRRKALGSTSSERVRLAAHQRVVRAQRFDAPGSFAHFRMLALTSAGRDEGDRRFELDALCLHTGLLARIVLDWTQLRAEDLRIALTVVDERRFGSVLEEWVEVRLPAALPDGVQVVADPLRETGRGYYHGTMFKLHARMGDEWLELGDGGDVDWTRKLLGSKKERCSIAGLGVERMLSLFG